MRTKCGQRQASVCRTTKKSNSLEFTLFDSHMHSAHCTPWIRAPRPFNSVAHANRQILVSNFVFDAFSGSDTTASHSHTQRPVSIFYINFEWIALFCGKLIFSFSFFDSLVVSSRFMYSQHADTSASGYSERLIAEQDDEIENV